MNGSFRKRALQAAVSMALIGGGSRNANVNVQCPGYNDGDAAGTRRQRAGCRGLPTRTTPNVKCMHLIAGDGLR